jgi:hypothetical protein
MKKKEKIVRPWRIRRLFKKLLAQPSHPFPQRGIGIDAPTAHGVYVIKKARVIWHVGRTTRAKNGLKQRLTGHLRGKSSFMDKKFKRKGDKLRSGFVYQYLKVKDHKHRAILEAYAAGCLCPRHFGTSEGSVVQ